MFGFFNGIGSNVASAAGGAVSGAFIMNLINKFSMKKKEIEINDLIERLGGNISDTELEKALNKVLILQTMAYRDKVLHDKEKLFLIQYIIENQYLPADLKISLIQELDKEIETNPFEYIELLKTKMKQKDTFSCMEEKHGFINVLYSLTLQDGQLDKEEIEYLQLISNACDLPIEHLNLKLGE